MVTGKPGPLPEAAQRDEVVDLLAGLAAAVLLLLVFVDRVGTARSALALVFAFFVPGRAVVSNWPRAAGWSAVGMSIAVSLGALILLATVSLWLRFWHPLALFQVEALLSLTGLAVAVVRRRRSSGRFAVPEE